jgi:hypothetical protein
MAGKAWFAVGFSFGPAMTSRFGPRHLPAGQRPPKVDGARRLRCSIDLLPAYPSIADFKPEALARPSGRGTVACHVFCNAFARKRANPERCGGRERVIARGTHVGARQFVTGASGHPVQGTQGHFKGKVRLTQRVHVTTTILSGWRRGICWC